MRPSCYHGRRGNLQRLHHADWLAADDAARAVSSTVEDNGPNPQGAQDTIATAGIAPAYVDIKSLTVPAAEF